MHAQTVVAVQHVSYREPTLEDLIAAQAFGEKIQKLRQKIGLEPFSDEQLKFNRWKYLEVKLRKR